MDRLDAIRLFLRVAESGGFSVVARELGVGQPTVSKRIAALEAHLGAQLLNRTSRSLSLTEAGQRFYDATVNLSADLEAAEMSARQGQSRPSGVLRLTVSAGFGRLRVMPLLPAFRALYPEVVVDLLVSDRFVDLVEEGIDLALRIGELADSSLTARRVGSSPRITVAAPAYLEARGSPSTPGDLDRHDRVAFTFQRAPRRWSFHGSEGPIGHMPLGPVRANDAENIRAAVLLGMGVAQTPRWLFSTEIASGAVVEVLRDYPSDVTNIYAVYPSGRALAVKARVFIDFIADAFARDPDLRPI